MLGCTEQWAHLAWQKGGGDVGPMAYRAFLGEHGDSPCSISLCPAPGSVLTMDHPSTHILSSCCKMSDIMEESITCEWPLPLICSTHQGSLLLWTHLTVRELTSSPEPLFKELRKSRITKTIKTLKGINMASLPYESQVRGGWDLEEQGRGVNGDVRHPTLRVQRGWGVGENLSLHPLLQQRGPGQDPSAGAVGDGSLSPVLQGPDKVHSQLLIVDQSFDLVSPLLHKLTYQAMAYDLLSIEINTYKRYETTGTSDSREKEALLDEDDKLWVQLRHMHIADVSMKVTELLHTFSESKKLTTDKYSTHLNLAEHCMRDFKGLVEKLCRVEQDLAMGTDMDGKKIKDSMKIIIPILLDPSGQAYDKLRIILLYILKNGVSEETLCKMIQDASIQQQGNIIHNTQLLSTSFMPGVPAAWPLLTCPPPPRLIPQDIIEDRLDRELWPFVSDPVPSTSSQAAVSARFEHWHKNKPAAEYPTGPCLIIYMLGGVSMSEMRCAY
uniref:Syntaxin-binding protein 2 n=1 Tax=Gopherus evgoodei TaxID=1825980 RepID=A0A8C4YUT8_9SAUR